MDGVFLDAMAIVKEKIPDKVGIDADINEYGIDRTLWRGSKSQSRIQGVEEADICATNQYTLRMPKTLYHPSTWWVIALLCDYYC
eukprot:1756376-Ditylum_brightwellii.AAC.1